MEKMKKLEDQRISTTNKKEIVTKIKELVSELNASVREGRKIGLSVEMLTSKACITGVPEPGLVVNITEQL